MLAEEANLDYINPQFTWNILKTRSIQADIQRDYVALYVQKLVGKGQSGQRSIR